MSLEDQYDAWVRGLMGGKKYAATSKQAEEASDAVQQMQASLDALTAAQKRQSAAGSALDAVQKAGAATAESVRIFQSIFGLPQTGIVDYPTWYKVSEIYVAVSRIAELNP